MTVKKKAEPKVQVHDLSKLKGEPRMIDGSISDDWNNIIANQALGRFGSERTQTPRRSRDQPAAARNGRCPNRHQAQGRV
jgi:hypothetical protein